MALFSYMPYFQHPCRLHHSERMGKLERTGCSHKRRSGRRERVVALVARFINKKENVILHCLEDYLTVTLTEWSAMEHGERSEACERTCDTLRKAIIELKEETEIATLAPL